MYYPEKQYEYSQQSLITDFGGLNKQYSIAENEFSDMENMSSRRYPLISTREKRGIVKGIARIKIDFGASKVPKNATRTVNGVTETVPASHIRTSKPKKPTSGYVFIQVDSEGQQVSDGDGAVQEKYRTDIIENNWTQLSTTDYTVTVQQTIGNELVDIPVVVGDLNALPNVANFNEGDKYIVLHENGTTANLYEVSTGKWLTSQLQSVGAIVTIRLSGSDVELQKGVNSEFSPIIPSPLIFKPNKEYYVYTDQNGFPIRVYKNLQKLVSRWVRIGKNDLFDIKYHTEYEYRTWNTPTAFKCDGAWIYSTVRFNGSRRLYIANNDFDESKIGFTIGDVGEQVSIDWDDAVNTKTLNGNDEVVEQVNALLDDTLKDAETKRQIVTMGGKICVFPEKYYINMFDHSDRGYMYNYRYPIWKDGYASGKYIRISPCTQEGKLYENATISNEAPKEPDNGQVWVDTSGEISIYKIWDASSKSWNQMSSTFVEIYCKGAFKGFKQWDAINIKGLDWSTIYKCGSARIDNTMTPAGDNFAESSNKFINILAKVANIVSTEQLKEIKDGDSALEFVKNKVKGQLNDISDKIVKQIETLNYDSAVLVKADDNSIVIAGLLDQPVYMQPFQIDTKLNKVAIQTDVQGQYSFRREVPDLDYYLECNNRIWGCKYGLNDNGDMVNEIYACKLGDPTNWNFFYGVSTDAYTLSLGTSGEFTGCINYNGVPTFFKDKYIHKIYGSYPAAYQLSTSTLRGTRFHDSLVVCNNYLYYATSKEFVVYDGSAVYSISGNLGKFKFKNVIAGTDNKKVYFQCTREDDTHVLYVYDTDTRLWHKEDDIDIMFFANDGECLFAMERYPEKHKYANGTEYTINRYRIITMTEDYNVIYKDDSWPYTDYPHWDDEVHWWMETGNIGFADPFGKYIQKISVRAKVEKNALYNVLISYDGGEYEPITPTNNAEGIKARDYIFRIRRCDYFKLKFIGKGDVTFISIYKTYVQGSDKN